MSEHIVLVAVDAFTPEHLDRVRGAVDGWGRVERISQFATRESYAAHLSEAEIVFGWPDPALLVESPVRVLLLPSVGYDAYAGGGLDAKPGFVLCNAAGVMSAAVAEHGIAMMLALARQLPYHLARQSEQSWTQPRPPYHQVADATACVIGLGSIGSEIARLCTGLGMKTRGVRRAAGGEHPYVDETYSLDNVVQAVSGQQHVFCALAATSATTGLISWKVFESMPRGAFFYSLSRGRVVDEQALIGMLESGHVGGAGLDVFTEEPLPATSPLWRHENVIITPHVAGRFESEFDRHCHLVVENLARYQSGQPLVNAVLGRLASNRLTK